MTRLARIIAIGSVTLLMVSLAPREQIQAQQPIGNNGLTGELRSLTAVVSGDSQVILLSIPADSNFVVAQVCRTTGTGSDHRLHNVAGGGENSQVTLDNTACQEYTPGIVYVGGDDVVFRNDSDTATRVLVNGILTKP
jgi:hypothetical protein